jgi:hypothetical protein
MNKNNKVLLKLYKKVKIQLIQKLVSMTMLKIKLLQYVSRRNSKKILSIKNTAKICQIHKRVWMTIKIINFL